MASLLSLDDAQQQVLSAISPGPTVPVPLRAAFGRTLAEPITCDTDYPPFDRALMDGFAVRSADVASAPATLKVVGQIPAGGGSSASLGPGQAMQICTGGPIPTGCDAVARVEETECSADSVTIRSTAPTGQFIARRASAVRSGQIVLEPGTRLTPPRIAVLAASGHHTAMVYAQPAVGVLVTGSELVEPEWVPAGAQIRDSNRYVLDALIRQAGCRPVDFGAVRDDKKALAARLRDGLDTGFLCTAGGVSMGEFDFVPACIEECGATIRFHKLAIKPGRPVLFATTEDGGCAFGLPGNPGSVFVAFWLLVRPALARRQGRTDVVPRSVSVRLLERLGPTGDRRTFRPALVEPNLQGEPQAKPLPTKGSGDPFGMGDANALIDSAPGTPAREAGDEARALLLEAL